MQILITRAFQAQYRVADNLTISRRRLGPIRTNRRPGIAQPFEVRIAVLRDQRTDPLRLCHGQTKTHRRAVIKHIQRIPREFQRIDKMPQGNCQVIEAVTVAPRLRHFGKTEARQIRRNNPVVSRQPRDQVAEHMR